MEEKITDERETIKIEEAFLRRMSLEQQIRAEQLYHQLGLDSVVNEVLTDFPSSLSRMDRVIDKIFGAYDIKGRAEAVARLTALVTNAVLSKEYYEKAQKFEAQIKSLEKERDTMRTDNNNLIRKVADIVGGNYDELKNNYYKLVDKLTEIQDLRPQIASLIQTLEKERAKLVDRVEKVTSGYGKAAEKKAEETTIHAEKALWDILKSTTGKAGIEVTLYTQTLVLIGSIYHLEERRLLDLLNNGSDQRGRSTSPFLELSYVHARNPDGRDTTLHTASIEKAAVYMAVLADTNAARGVGAKDSHSSLPFVPKSPVQVELQMVDFMINGNMHCASGQKPQDVLDEKTRFLPLTDVTIRMLRNDIYNIELTAPFVAINKEHVVSSAQKYLNPADLKLLELYRKLIELELGYLYKNPPVVSG